MPAKRLTSKAAAAASSKVLKSRSTGKASKTAAGSALSQTKAPHRVTSSSAAASASKTLRDGRTGKDSKSAAGSALSQAKRTKS